MPSVILDSSGNPMPSARRASAARQELHQLAVSTRRADSRNHPQINATYDAAQNSDDMKNYWSAADPLDADWSNSKAVRHRLVIRSRYEAANNGYFDGMVQTHANYLVGTGPALRMQTGSAGFNALVERDWGVWCKTVHFRRKLWCMAHAKVQDGEAFGILRNNPKAGPTELDTVLVETEQCTTPMLPYGMPGFIDGIHFDEFGNPIWYDILKYHPGGQWFNPGQFIPEQIPAKFVVHWFAMQRPGQHRGAPEFRSTMNTGATARRWREATVAAAETAADIAALLTTTLAPDSEADLVAPLTAVEFQKRMMTSLPMGWDARQMKGEHPNATFEAFHKAQINEQARPKSMPYNLAACDSSTYNYASGRLDHQTYFSAIDVEREDANDLVLDPIFGMWFERYALFMGFSGNPQVAPSHTWDWPKHPVADVESEANANDKQLKNGTKSPSRIYSEAGLDFENEIQVMAADYGVTVERMKEILWKQNFAVAATIEGQTAMQEAKGNIDPAKSLKVNDGGKNVA